MFGYINQSGQVQYNVVELVVDKEVDILTLPTSYAPGSTVFIIETSKAYMLSNEHNWEEMK